MAANAPDEDWAARRKKMQAYLADQDRLLRQKGLDDAPLDTVKWLRRIFWLLLIGFFVVPFLWGLVLGIL
jgi:hypothetical protein